MSELREAVDEYLAIRRALGFKLVSVRKRAFMAAMYHMYSTRVIIFLRFSMYCCAEAVLESRMDIRTAQGNLKDNETGGVQASRWRARVWRLNARTASCTYAWKDSNPDQVQRSSPKARLVAEMMPSMPERHLRRRL